MSTQKYPARSFRIFMLAAFQFLSTYCSAQNPHIQFDHIGTANGLSLGNVETMMQDSRGFMWFGTPDGLNRWDGYRFTVYKNIATDTQSITNNYIRSIAKSKNGDLWVATLGGGVCKFIREKENFVRYVHNPHNKNSIANNNVNSVWEDENGNVWMGTENGLDVFNEQQQRFEHFTHADNDSTSISDNYIKTIFEDSQHNLWIGTLRGGINLFNRKAKTFTRFEHNANNPASIATNSIITIYEDNEKRLWIGTEGAGMDYFDRQNNIFHHYKKEEKNSNSLSENSVYAFNEDEQGSLWVGTENGGLSLFNYSTGKFLTYKNDEIDRESISNNSINAIFKDTKKNMWLANYSGGIDMVSSDKGRFFHYKRMLQKNSLSNNNVLCMLEDSKQQIWIGTDGGGMNIFDPESNTFTCLKHNADNEQSLSGDYVVAVCEDSKGNIWMGSWSAGISVYNPATKTFRHFKNDPANPASLVTNNVWRIFEDKAKHIWVGTYGGGLELLNADGKSFTHFTNNPNNPTSISSNNIENIFEDHNNNLWILTDGGGLNLLNKKDFTFTTFMHDNTKNSISNNSPYSIFEDGEYNLWISTRNGLNKYNRNTNHFSVFTTEDGLPGNVVFGLLEDDKKNYWISTNKGISCFNPGSKTFKNYTVSDGLQAAEFKEFAYCKSKTGLMYFGGVNGFNQFSPDSIRSIEFDPPLVITNFQVFNKKVPIAGPSIESPLTKSITETSSITLPSSSSVFSFEFASLNYASAEKKKYAYMLENFDKDWNEAGSERMATYTHLDPGEYVFKVKGVDNQGRWSPKIISIKVIITPPYYLTWWFKTLVFLGITGSIVAIYINRMREIHNQQKKLQQQVDEKTNQLVLANKDLTMKNKELEQFAYVASHDLQEPLRTTAGFVDLLKHQYKGKLDEKADKYLAFISEASNRMRTLIKDLLDFSRIGAKTEFEKVNCNDVLKNVKQDIMAALTETGAAIECDTLPVVNGHASELQVLFQNLILNAIKFRQKDTIPQIVISVTKVNRYWQFAFKDNGIGIEKQYWERIFDIFQRLHNRSEYEGSGIGLSHCKKIVELHYGKIWVESKPGEGSTFYFTIPDSKPLG